MTASPRRDGRPIRVLLAEDDDDLRDALVCILVAAGYAVRALSSGAALLDVLAPSILGEAEAPADAIVTDVRMPGFNGLNIIEGLRENGWKQPVVIISAFCDEAMEARVARMTRTRLFPKPFNASDLERAIGQLIGN